MRLCFDVNRHSHASAGNAVISKSGLGADMDIVFSSTRRIRLAT